MRSGRRADLAADRLRASIGLLRRAVETGELGRAEASARVCELARALLHASVATLWEVEDTAAGPRLVLLGRRDAGAGPDALPLADHLTGARVGEHLLALREGVLVTEDADAARPAGVPPPLPLLPGHPARRLDAGVCVNGRTIGLLCCGRGGGRPWSALEARRLRALAQAIALAVARTRKDARHRASIAAVPDHWPASGPAGLPGAGTGE